MPRYKESFTLYPRRMKDGTVVYYYRTYDENGRRTHGISTAMTTKPAARSHCMKLFKEGKLVPKQTETFADFTEDFWVWDKCTYILRCNNLKTGRKRVSKEHARTERGYLVNHIQPYFGKKKLTAIQERDIEDFIIHLKKTTTLASGTINHIIKIIKIVFAEALRQKLIYENPAKDISRIEANQQDRGMLTLREADQLLHPKNIGTYWDGCLVIYAMNVLSATTGMRRGELLGLLNKNIHSDHISVVHGWGQLTDLRRPPSPNEIANHPLRRIFTIC